MRALRKIVFINSAHIRYAEVRLDGNVHFIGTQGVGKSTLLRAILFFYNADKLHLGIPKEMKSFDEFYLPHANSYIVYEVEHENGPFCILTFRNSGRACYRFIDSEYHKEWLIDQNGEVTAESKVIRERLCGAYMSKIVDRYEQYRDIIYGNGMALGKEFARFRLMESNRYQNIPRSIQNVFLNSRLDADFIKDIIIRSMSEEEANIDLGYYRRQVSDFEQEYKDISLWYRLNPKGESTVRRQAEAVVNAYHDLLYMRRQIEELCGELNYAVRTSRERLPLIGKKIEELQELIGRQKRLLNELQQKFEEEKSGLNREQGAVSDRLKRLKERREYYASQQIDNVLQRCDKEQLLRGKLEADKVRLTELTAKFNDITAKFNTLRQTVNAQLENYRIKQNARINRLSEEKQRTEELLLDDHTRQRDSIEADFKEKITLAENVVAQLKEQQTEVDKEMLKLKFLHPYKDELDALRKSLGELALREKDLTGFIATTEAEIRQRQAEYDKLEVEIITNNQKLQEAKQQEITSVLEKLAETEALLSRAKGSLYEWLEDNKHGWEQNIGKVINEEKVLYRTDLQPEKAEGDSLFGVKIDLLDLPLAVRKPDQLKEEKAELEKELNKLKGEIVEITKLQEQKIDELKQQFGPKMKELRYQKSSYEAELLQIPQKRKAIQVKIDDFEAKAKQETESRSNELAAREQELSHRRTASDDELAKIKTERDKTLQAEKNRYKKAKAEAASLHNSKVDEIRSEIIQQEKRTESELQQLARKERDELHGRGADTTLVDECRTAIRASENELKYIEEHREIVYAYIRDKEELFDKEDELKGQKKQLGEKLMQLGERYGLRRQNHDRQLSTLEKELSGRYQEKRLIDEDLQKAERFIQDENLCPPILSETPEHQSLRTPGQATDELTGIIVSRQKQQNQFKEKINIFKSNFSAKNTFNFRMELSINEDFMEFASNLDDFLSYNKIEEYRRRTSERYVDILARVSKEMGELTRHEGDVEKIINDINADFRERNFVGVIKQIALRQVPSTDKMVQLMKRIKDFNDENQFTLGEVNLFSANNRDDINQKSVDYLLDLMKSLIDNPQNQFLTLSDLFQLQFRIVENDNDTGWADKLSHVGSEGTDTLVKAMINIMLINVFKEKNSRKFADFRLHCMMDEIGKLHPQNVKGILDFANARNILLINSSPTTYNVSDYRYTYLLSKDGKSQTAVHPLIAQK